MGDEVKSAKDPRLEWLEKWVELKLTVKPNVFKKMLNGETGTFLSNFLSNPDVRRLFVWGKDKDNKELVCGDMPPAVLRRRAVYFVTLERSAITAENINSLVMPGDLLPNALGQMHRLCEAAYLPLLSNPENVGNMPTLVMGELVDGLTRMSAVVYMTLGQAQGRTLLPLPPADAAAPERTARDKERVRSFETAVVTWTRQIKAALKSDPEGVGSDKPGATVRRTSLTLTLTLTPAPPYRLPSRLTSPVTAPRPTPIALATLPRGPIPRSSHHAHCLPPSPFRCLPGAIVWADARDGLLVRPRRQPVVDWAAAALATLSQADARARVVEFKLPVRSLAARG